LFEDLLGKKKPVIAMAHFPALPGSPEYDRSAGVDGLYEWVRADVEALVQNGVDAVMFGNEGDRPYLTEVSPVVPATMAAVISRVRQDYDFAFGVDILWDPIATIALAQATGALFAREVFTGVYASDMGLWDTGCGEAYRYKHNIGAEKLKLLYNIKAEFAAPVARRELGELARSVVFSSLADALCVSGPMTGEEAELAHLTTVKEAVPDTPVLANTGVTVDTVEQVLSTADGVVVGTSLKRDGSTWNPVDPERVARFMEAARRAR
jgi:hypothetical protein